MLLREKRHLITTDVATFNEIRKVIEEYYVEAAVIDFKRRFGLVTVEIICRNLEWMLLKRKLPVLRKEGYMYSL